MRRAVFGIMMAAVGLLTAGCKPEAEQGDATPREPPPVVVRVIVVDRGDVEVHLETTGTLKAHRESKVGPRISGIVHRVLVEEGMEVKEGDPLIQMDTSELVLIRDEAQAALGVAKAHLARILAGSRPEVVEQARARLKEAEALYQNASAERRRVETLFRKGTVPRKLYDQAVAQHEAAEAALEAAREGLRMALKGATKEEVQVARAEVARAEAALRRAEQALKDAVIRAPFGGVVVRRFVNKGEYVSTVAQTPLLWLMDIDPVELEIQIPEEHCREVAVGSPVEISPDALPGESFQGRVTEIIPVVDPLSRTIRVKVRIPNPNRRLTAGMFCRVRLTVAEKRNVVRVPMQAVIYREGQPVVFLLRGDRVRRRALHLGAVDDRYGEVLSGLKPGDRIVIEGQEVLEEGMRVVLASAAGPASPTPASEEKAP
jgi:multidrug efflux pump subunit AcrA (membrane-fusion protein)